MPGVSLQLNSIALRHIPDVRRERSADLPVLFFFLLNDDSGSDHHHQRLCFPTDSDISKQAIDKGDPAEDRDAPLIPPLRFRRSSESSFLFGRAQLVIRIPPKYLKDVARPDSPEPLLARQAKSEQILNVIQLQLPQPPLGFRYQLIDWNGMISLLVALNITPRHRLVLHQFREKSLPQVSLLDQIPTPRSLDIKQRRPPNRRQMVRARVDSWLGSWSLY